MDIFLKVYKTAKYVGPQLVNRSCSTSVIAKGTKDLGKEREKNEIKAQEVYVISREEQLHNAIGAADELTSYIGFAREFALDKEHPYTDKLTRIQTLLVDIKLEMNSNSKRLDTIFFKKYTQEVEEWIQEYSKNLPPKEKYILPGGGKASSSLHVARTICHRAEKSVEPLVNGGMIDKGILIYFKRLGNFLLTVSRYAAKADKRTESVYTPLGAPNENTNTGELKI